MATTYENFLKIRHNIFLNSLEVENFDEIALPRTVKEIAQGLHLEQFPIEILWDNLDL